jgi:hypothetical protein
MATIWQCLQNPNIVRAPSEGRVPWARCAAALIVTALTVYGLECGWRRFINGPPTYTATAYVVDNAQEVYPLIATNRDPRRAAVAANALADLAAADRRALWQRERRQAHEATEKARQDYSESTARLETFRQQQDETAHTRSAGDQPATQPSMIDNPQWLGAQQKLANLRCRRDQLLAQRTRLHPAVVEIEGRIAEAEQQLAAIPQTISGTSAGPAAPAPSPAELLAAKNKEQAQQDLNALTAAAEASRLAFEQAQCAERQLVQAAPAEPNLVVRYAQGAQRDIAPLADNWQRLLWTALAAGVLMAFGVGLLSLAAGIEPPLASLADVLACLDAPILGVVPVLGPPPDLAAIRRQTRLRRATMATGACLTVACLAAALWGMAG